MLCLRPSSVFLAHSPADRAYAERLAAFLELGCDVHCNLEAGRMEPGEDLVEKVEQGSETLILLLSKHSWPARLPRERWDPVLLDTPLISVLLEDCPVPELLRRQNFIDARKRDPGRELKRRIWRQTRELPDDGHAGRWSSDLEDIYAAIADQPGLHIADGAEASRFAAEASDDFESVLWVPCHGRTLAECAGELGERLGAVLDGTVEENCRRIGEFLSSRRLLLVLDAPPEEVIDAFSQSGRSSILVTEDPVEVLVTPGTLDYGFQLVSRKRLAEAYDLLRPLADQMDEASPCARELAWICERWGRVAEADAWRLQCDLMPTRQLSLFD